MSGMDALEPSIRQRCDALLPHLPEEHREEARARLAHRLLPARLRGRPGHPAPGRLTALISLVAFAGPCSARCHAALH